MQPFKYITEVASTNTFSPSISKVLSIIPAAFSNCMEYENPEHPPPTTPMRRPAGTGVCWASMPLTLETALAVKVTGAAFVVTLTANAVSKVKGIMAQQTPVPAGLRIGVVGGGCSGFSYSMQFENAAGMMDKAFEMDGLKVFVDATSVMYLNGCIVDYVETLEGAGFKFENPNVKSTCGCGSSFQV